MAIVATIIPEVQDIVDNAAVRELFIVAKEMERPPYWHEGEGLNARLGKALRVVQDGRITPNSDGSYTVEGSAQRTYRVTNSCSCPQSQKGKSKYCYHFVAVCLYIEWCRRVGHADQAALPLPPVTIDERLSAPAQEDPMPDDADAYIPEPDAAPVATLERPTPEPAHMTQAVRTGHALLAQEDDLEHALTLWTAQRAVVQRFLKQELKANIDYYTLKIGGRESKPSLSKAGAEKVMGWLKMQASFAPDTGTWEMLGRPTEFVAYICTLRTRSGEIIGEGRGARYTKKDNDINKSIKMALKSAQIDAILRTGALSDVFTQDAEDMQDEPAKPTPAKPSSQELRQRIWAMVTAQAPQQATTREAVTAWIMQTTGYELVPDNYPAIVRILEGRA